MHNSDARHLGNIFLKMFVPCIRIVQDLRKIIWKFFCSISYSILLQDNGADAGKCLSCLLSFLHISDISFCCIYSYSILLQDMEQMQENVYPVFCHSCTFLTSVSAVFILTPFFYKIWSRCRKMFILSSVILTHFWHQFLHKKSWEELLKICRNYWT